MNWYIFVMVISGAAFYLALSGWTNDAYDRARVRNQMRNHQPADDRFIQSEATIAKANQRLQRIQTLNSVLDTLVVNHTSVTAIDEYNSLYASQQLANNSCNSQLATMETTLAQLVFLANATTVQTLLLGGRCEFGSSSFVNYHYETVSIGGLDFYYYTFLAPASGGNVTAIQNCIPPILTSGGNVYERALFDTELTAFNGTAVGIEGIRIGQERIEFLPTGNYSLDLTESFILVIV